LQLWLGFLLLVLLSGFGTVVYELQRISQRNALDVELQKRVAAVSMALRGGPRPFQRGRPGPRPDWEDGREMRPPPDFKEERFGGPPPDGPFGGPPGRPGERGRVGIPGGPFGPRELRLPTAVQALFEPAETNGYYFFIWSRDGSPFTNSVNAPQVPEPVNADNDTQPHFQMRETFREVYHFTELGDCVLAGKSMAQQLGAQHRFGFILLGAGAAVLALGLGTGWWFTTRAIRPVEEIGAAAKRISAGNLSERVTVDDPRNELGRLAEVLNSTFARLEAAFKRQTQFTADAAHELRTPLAVIISETQTALNRERTPAEYRQTIEECLDTAQQMRRLTESLLMLARTEVKGDRLEPRQVDLGEEARNCVEQLKPLAGKTGIEIQTDFKPSMVFVNVDRLRQVITNLLANAIHYNKPNGSVTVRTESAGSTSSIIVSDTGQGIAPEDLPHIFGRFYRADRVRSQIDGRTGLGLAICKAIVDAEGGSIEVESKLGVGTTFTVQLPKGDTSASGN
jgi:two-component system OmpR family sensor kinase